MKIEFENGSIIESIDTNEKPIRGRSAEIFKQNNIKSLNYKELDNKTLKMIVAESEGIRIVAGQDVDTGRVYVINYDYIKEEN